MYDKALRTHSTEFDPAQSQNRLIAAMMHAEESLHKRSSEFGLISMNDHEGDAVSGGIPRPDGTESDLGITATKFACRPHASRKLCTIVARRNCVGSRWRLSKQTFTHTEVVRACEGAEFVVSILLALVKVLICAQGALLGAAIEAGVLRFVLSLQNYLSSCFRIICRKVLACES